MQLRAATPDDIDGCVDVQRRSAVVGYSHIFDQAVYPFPADVVRAEWVARFADDVAVTVATDGAEILGTVSVRPPRLESLFVVPDCWGHGVARSLHDEAVRQISDAGWRSAELDVMVDNDRARRFYEKHGWVPDGRTATSPFPPYPKLLGYHLELDGRARIDG
jgi:GNAT superfamily N-acetyltransferase